MARCSSAESEKTSRSGCAAPASIGSTTATWPCVAAAAAAAGGSGARTSRRRSARGATASGWRAGDRGAQLRESAGRHGAQHDLGLLPAAGGLHLHAHTPNTRCRMPWTLSSDCTRPAAPTPRAPTRRRSGTRSRRPSSRVGGRRTSGRSRAATAPPGDEREDERRAQRRPRVEGRRRTAWRRTRSRSGSRGLAQRVDGHHGDARRVQARRRLRAHPASGSASRCGRAPPWPRRRAARGSGCAPGGRVEDHRREAEQPLERRRAGCRRAARAASARACA